MNVRKNWMEIFQEKILLGMYLFLALEIFAKVYIFNLTLLSYLPELLLLIGVGLYAIIRRMYVGIDIRDIVENTGKERIFICFWDFL